MTTSQVTQGGNISLTVSSANFFPIGIGYIPTATTTESSAQIPYRTAATVSSLYAVIPTNTTAVSSTIRFRNNAASGNQILTIGPSSTGEFTDVTNSDTISSGNKLDYQIIAASSGTLALRTLSILFSPTTSSNTISRLVCSNLTIDTSSALNVNFYYPLGGRLDNSTNSQTETNSQFKINSAGTIQNLFINIASNTLTIATLKSRKNTANGNLNISISSGQTGIVEDTTNSDTISSGDLANYVLDSTTITTLQLNSLGSDFVSTNGISLLMAGAPQATSIATGQSSFFGIAGSLTNPTTIEANVKSKALTSFTTSSLQIYLPSNGGTGTATFKFRKNTASGNQTISIPASSSGMYQDTTNNDSISSGDEINYLFTTPSSGTNSVISLNGCLASYISTTLLTMDNNFPYEFLTGLSLDRTLPYESTGGIILTSDVNMPFEFKGTVQTDKNLPFSFLGKLSKDISLPDEILARENCDINFPFSFKASVSADQNIPEESLSRQQRDVAMPFEDLGAVTLTMDDLLPFEILAKLQRDSVLQYEDTGKLSIDCLLPEEILALASIDTKLWDEILASQNIDKTVPDEIMGAVQLTSDKLLPFEILAQQQPERNIPYEWKGNLSRDTVLQAESLARTAIDNNFPLETLAQLRRDGLGALEIIGSILSDVSLPYEVVKVLTSLTSDRALQFEFLGSAQMDARLPLEFSRTGITLGAIIISDKIRFNVALSDTAKFNLSISDRPLYQVNLTDE